MQFTGFIGPSYTLASVNADAQRAVNLYPEVDELGTEKNQEIARLVSRPPLRPKYTFSPGPIRGMYAASNGRIFIVSGINFYELVSGVATPRGTLTTNIGRIEMTDNGLQLLLSEGYTFTFSTNAFAKIDASQAFPNATDVAFIDQYCIANSRGTKQFFISNLSDATLWDGLDVGQKEGGPDLLITLIADHRELILFGDLTTEFWYDSGAAAFPFERRSDVFIEKGIVGPGAKAKMDSGVFFWAKDKTGFVMAMRINGYVPQRISTHAIEDAVRGYGDLSGTTCFCYQWNGHSFWVTNFQNANVSWVYDAATKLWHECQSGNNRWRAQYHCFDGQHHLIGDCENGSIYQLGSVSDTYDDDGTYIPRIRRAPHVSQQLSRVVHACFQLDMETGTVPQGLDPQIVLRISDDGGHSWGNEKMRSAGKAGEYKKRIRWYRLGQSRDRVYEVKITDAIPVTMLAAYINPED